MRILCTGDWHLGLVVGGYDFHDDIVEMCQVIVEDADKADLVVHLGDLFHSPRPDPRAYAAAIELLGSFHPNVIVLAGNHDAGRGTVADYRNGGRAPAPDAFEPLRKVLKNVAFISYPTIFEYEDLSFGVLPYVTDTVARHVEGSTAQEWIEKVYRESLRAGVKAVFSHLEVEGAKLGENTVMRGTGLSLPETSAPCPIVNGHIHRNQVVGGTIIPGSVVPTEFQRKREEKGYVVIRVLEN